VTILEFLTLVPEEISSTELSGDRKSKLVQEMKESVPLVLSIMSSMLFSTTPTETNLQQKTLRCFQSWVQYGIEFEAAYPLLQQTMVLVTKEDTFEIATEVLLEAMQQHTWLRYNTLRDDMLQCITSEEMKTQFTGSISEQDEDTSKSLAKLFTAYGEAYADFIAEQLCRQDILVLMDMLMQLTAFSGYFPVDQELSDIPLNFWYVLQETLIDDGILPVQDSTQWRRQCGEAALMIYRQLVITIQQKAMFPPDNVWNSWTQEHAVAVMDHWDSIPFSSQDLEATLFCLKSVSEEVSPEENEHIHKFFGAKIFGRLPREGHTRLQNTAILLMGSLSEWLNQHPQLLAQIMNYLVPCLSVPKLALSAASTFSDICDACREPLTDELDNLINTYNFNVKQKVVVSIANVIQVLPPDIAISPIMTIITSILQYSSEALEMVKSDPELAQSMILIQLKYLSAFSKGIQSPSDDYQSVSTRHKFYDSFVRGELTTIYTTIEGVAQISDAMRDLTRDIARVWSTDEQVMKILSSFLELGTRSANPIFALPFPDLILLVQISYQHSLFSCWLNTAKFIVTVYGGQESCYPTFLEVIASITDSTLKLITNTQGEIDERKNLIGS
ncbi:armadillo-type protein, partial [Spinellus fusiger]